MQDFHNATLEKQAVIVYDLGYVMEEKEALMRTTWSDVDFHCGDEGNRELLERLEMQFAGQLADTINTIKEFRQLELKSDQGNSSQTTSAGPEKRYDGREGPFTYEEFAEFYGKDKAPSRWQMAGRAQKGVAATDEAPEMIDEEQEGAVLGLVLADQDASRTAASLANVNQETVNDTLWEAKNLGVAIDLVGAYLKNYEIDKADALITRVLPLCRERGGAWLIKGLDKMSTVRMKQQRHYEALDMLREMERVVPFKPEESWEFFDILYRNLAWAYTAQDDSENCIKYTKKSIEIKKMCGIQATWFDIWDLGTAHARLGQKTNQREEMQVAHALCAKAARIHEKAEPNDKVMLAKIHMSVGEIAMGIGDYDFTKGLEDNATEWYAKAEAPLIRAHELMTSVLGPLKPLAGWTAGNLAHCYYRLERYEECRDYLKDAFKIECYKDATTCDSVLSLLGRVINVHTQLVDTEGMRNYVDDIDCALAGLREHGWDRKQRHEFAQLMQKVATAFLMADDGTGNMVPRALKVLREGEESMLAYKREPQGGAQADADETLEQIRSSINILSFS